MKHYKVATVKVRSNVSRYFLNVRGQKTVMLTNKKELSKAITPLKKAA